MKTKQISDNTLRMDWLYGQQQTTGRNQYAMALLAPYRDKASSHDIEKVNQKLGGMNKDALQRRWAQLSGLWGMVNDAGVAWTSKAVALGALLYLITPMDAIPDITPLLGLTDDAAVIAAAVASLGAALNKYKKGSH